MKYRIREAKTHFGDGHTDIGYYAEYQRRFWPYWFWRKLPYVPKYGDDTAELARQKIADHSAHMVHTRETRVLNVTIFD